jgi:ATP-binding cassette subfamily C protein
VEFAYGDRLVLAGADMVLPAGRLTTLVGPSGAGKTTIVDLVTGLLRPGAGEVFVDGVPLSQLDVRQWRRMIGYVPQDTVLLHDTIFRNITLGASELGERDVEEALVSAGAWEFVQATPQGIHSTVGERGGKLSGGQRQRIAIARALVHRPKLLILDEATSALDPVSEAVICDALWRLRGEITILAITHQAALVNGADRVYRLEDKRLHLQRECTSSGVDAGSVRGDNAAPGAIDASPGREAAKG